MDELCDFVIENINLCNDITIVAEGASNCEFDDIDRCIKIVVDRLQIDKNDIKIIEDNTLNQKEISISFTFKGRPCHLYEITGIHRDYLGVELMPIS